MTERQRLWGKYRGTVVSTVDPMLKGRLTAALTLGGAPLTLVAEACVPYPGFYAIPPEGSGVWIEFEEGNIDKPIWSGCWWHDGELATLLMPDLPPPTPLEAPKTVVLAAVPVGRGIATARLKLAAISGKATLESTLPPASPALPSAIRIGVDGVELCYGPNTIRLSLLSVDIDKGALTITPVPMP